jgi:hypothetical protein
MFIKAKDENEAMMTAYDVRDVPNARVEHFTVVSGIEEVEDDEGLS